MSQIPSDIAASAAAAGLQSREVATQRDARRAAQSQAVARQIKSVTDAGNTVETTDSDDQVFVDAEGQGSQGRTFEDQDSSSNNSAAPDSSASSDPSGPFHLDIEA